MDWSAINEDTYDGAPDSGLIAHLCGRGPTEEAAIQDLKTLMAEHDLCCECGAALADGRCEACDLARAEGKASASRHGMPWETRA